jgi:hypothetical protein
MQTYEQMGDAVADAMQNNIRLAEERRRSGSST